MERTKFSICHEFVQRYTQHDSTNIEIAQNLWGLLQCEKLPLPLAQVVYFVADNGNNKQNAIKLLQESYNQVGAEHLDVFTLINENGVIDDALLNGCAELEKHGMHFYTARHMLRRRFKEVFHAKPPTHNDKLKTMFNSLMEHLSLLERSA